ncbi:hypothetical protein MtrunA17_Chr8g0383111 [Medicago truncatula]|uniref:Transmembrane protein n=1 Tax=Medicago truncatula TaxID=3880 RepID=A0A396GPH1_MEDTR|nr:hypothetical protein MtrunA17_Chr8g0383111 [Medicago truncatula]
MCINRRTQRLDIVKGKPLEERLSPILSYFLVKVFFLFHSIVGFLTIHHFICNLSQNANGRKKPLKKHKRSPIVGVEDKGSKTSRQPRKQAVRELSKNPFNKAVEVDDVLDPPYEFDGDVLEENDDEDEVDYSFNMKRASTSSKKKSVAKTGKTYKKTQKG